jgi:hypothetical protein
MIFVQKRLLTVNHETETVAAASDLKGALEILKECRQKEPGCGFCLSKKPGKNWRKDT